MEAGQPPISLLPNAIIPISILVAPGSRPMVLAQDQETIAKLESAGEMEAALAKQAPFDLGGYKILFRGVTAYQSHRLLYDCLAIKLNGAAPAPAPKI